MRLLQGPEFSKYTDGFVHSKTVVSLNFSPNGMLLVSGSEDCTAVIWSVANMANLHVLSSHKTSITATAFISDVTLATASADGQLLLWDTSTGKNSKVIEQAHSQSISHISLSSGMVLFATASVDHTINVYEANSLKIVSTIECDGAVRSLTFADNSVIVAGIDEIGLFSYHATNGKCIKQYDFGSGVTASVCATCKSIKQIKILNLN